MSFDEEEELIDDEDDPCQECKFWQDISDPDEYYPEFECCAPNGECPYGVR